MRRSVLARAVAAARRSRSARSAPRSHIEQHGVIDRLFEEIECAVLERGTGPGDVAVRGEHYDRHLFVSIAQRFPAARVLTFPACADRSARNHMSSSQVGLRAELRCQAHDEARAAEATPNGSNNRSARFASIPGPESSTAINTFVPCVAAVISMRRG
jgi:hypothetical protein